MKKLPVSFKFNGDLEEIKANVLLVSLLGYVNLLEEVHNELNLPKKLDIYIKSTSKGSFIVDLNLALDTIDKIKSLLGDNLSFDHLKNIVEISTFLILIKVFLRGEKPKEIKEENGKVVIINNDNAKLTINGDIFKIAKENEVIDEAISSMSEPLVSDENIDGFEIYNEDVDLKVSKEEMEFLIKPNPLLEEKTQTIVKKGVTLTVFKVVFDAKRKWEFIYEGNKISAYIKDDEFFKNLDAISFKRGTKIVCDLEILQVYDNKIKDFVNEEFSIIKVHKVINPPENKNLF